MERLLFSCLFTISSAIMRYEEIATTWHKYGDFAKDLELERVGFLACYLS